MIAVRRSRKRGLAAIVAFSCWNSEVVVGSSNSVFRPSKPLLQQLVEARLGHGGAANDDGENGSASSASATAAPTHAIWAYTGALYDALSGNKIANVQGLELVRCLASTDQTLLSRLRFRRRCGALQIGPAVGKANANLEYAATLLSRKLFCYIDPETRSRPQLLRSLRFRPQGPRKVIPLNQAASVFDMAATVVQQADKSWLVHGERPKGLCVSSRTKVQSKLVGARRMIEFTVTSRPTTCNRIPDLTTDATTTRDGAMLAPKRVRWIQFGGDKSLQGYQPVRETYQYTLPAPPDSTTQQTWQWLQEAWLRIRRPPSTTAKDDNTSCTVRYTRYGEGPVWYNGRTCVLELHGRLVRSWRRDVPAVPAQVAAQHLPMFLSVHAPVPTNDDDAQRVVAWFLGRGGQHPHPGVPEAPPLEFVNVDDDVHVGGTSSWSKASRKWMRQGHQLLQRLQAATVLKATPLSGTFNA